MCNSMHPPSLLPLSVPSWHTLGLWEHSAPDTLLMFLGAQVGPHQQKPVFYAATISSGIYLHLFPIPDSGLCCPHATSLVPLELIRPASHCPRATLSS